MRISHAKGRNGMVRYICRMKRIGVMERQEQSTKEDEVKDHSQRKQSVMPSNILRYNQVHKFRGSEFKFNIRVLLRVYLNTESQCSREKPSRFQSSKEQAEVYYQMTTSLYMLGLKYEAR